jgi:hypothetical protein
MEERLFVGLVAYQGKDIVFRFIIEYDGRLMDFLFVLFYCCVSCYALGIVGKTSIKSVLDQNKNPAETVKLLLFIITGV